MRTDCHVSTVRIPKTNPLRDADSKPLNTNLELHLLRPSFARTLDPILAPVLLELALLPFGGGLEVPACVPRRIYDEAYASRAQRAYGNRTRSRYQPRGLARS